jgi:hypothetical protein
MCVSGGTCANKNHFFAWWGFMHFFHRGSNYETGFVRYYFSEYIDLKLNAQL